jgi:hypothetical protein
MCYGECRGVLQLSTDCILCNKVPYTTYIILGTKANGQLNTKALDLMWYSSYRLYYALAIIAVLCRTSSGPLVWAELLMRSTTELFRRWCSLAVKITSDVDGHHCAFLFLCAHSSSH